MPRYYFHVLDDLVALDEEGVELPDLDTVKRQAFVAARELIAEEVRVHARVPLYHRIEVTDEQGEVVLTLPFKEVVKIEDAEAA
jgi:hypothetical protein